MRERRGNFEREFDEDFEVVTLTRLQLRWRRDDMYVTPTHVMRETGCPARVNGGWLSMDFGTDVSHGQ